MVEIVRLSSLRYQYYCCRVAHLHMGEIHHGVLPLFGQGFLARLYYELDQLPRTSVWCAVNSGKIYGFVAGCADVRKSYLHLFVKAGIPLLLLTGRSLIRLPVALKVLTVAAYPFQNYIEVDSKSKQKRNSETNAEILAIAVDQRFRRQGVAKKLIFAFEESLKKWNVKGFYKVATNIAETDSNAFYRSMGFEIVGQKKHHDLILQMYQKRVAG